MTNKQKRLMKKKYSLLFYEKLIVKKDLMLQDVFTRLFFQEYRYLNLNTAQLVKLKRPFRSRYIKRKPVSLKLWWYKKKNFINEFWLPYVTLPKVQSFFTWKKRVISTFKAIKKVESKGRSWYNPVYELYKKSKKRKRFFSLKKAIYKAYPWMNTLVFKRKLTKLIRKRSFCRETTPFYERKLIPYRKWLRSVRGKRWKGSRGNKIPQQDKLVRKYLILPYFPQYNSTTFKKKIEKLRKVHHFNQGNYTRGYFENRLQYMLYYLNFAPEPYSSKYLSNRNFALISNSSNPSVMNSNSIKHFLKPSIKTNPAEKSINIQFVNKIEIAKNINRENKLVYEEKNKWKNRSIKEYLEYNNHEILAYNTVRDSTSLKKGDILTVSATYKKINTVFFMNKLQKKVTPGCFKWNADKTAALMIRNLHQIDFSEKNRVSRKRWNASILFTTKRKN